MDENEVEGDFETTEEEEDEDEDDIGVSDSGGDAGDPDETIEDESEVKIISLVTSSRSIGSLQ